MKKLIFTLLCLFCVIGAKAQQMSSTDNLTYTDDNGTTWTYSVCFLWGWDDENQCEVFIESYSVITGISGDLTNVVIPKSFIYNEIEQPVNSINDGVFSGGSIKSVQLPDNWESIPAGMFYGCSSLREITIPESVTTIGNEAFYGCSSLTSISIPEGVTSIGNLAFAFSDNLTTINIPASVTTISESAFEMCHNLSSVYLESTTPPTAYSPNVFTWLMEGVTTFIVDKEAIAAYKASSVWQGYNIYCEEEVVDYTYTDGYDVTWTYRYVYSNSSVRIVKAEGYTTSIDVPATLPYEEQQLPVTAIECSFVGDENIVSVDLSKTSITTIPSFSGCSSLSTVLLPSTLESISEYAFYNCSNLQSIDLSATKVKEIKNNAFYHCSNLSEITFPAALSTISDWAFNGCKFESLDFSETNLATIGEGAFWGCSLNSVYFPEFLEKIGRSAFCDCYELRNVDLSMVKEIEDNAFINIYLGTADISSAEKIGSEAFNRDITFTINATTPADIKANSFTADSKFIVTPDAYDDFCSETIWKKWADNISMYTIDGNNIKWIYKSLADSKGLCITSASGHGTEVTIPSTLPYNGEDVAVIQIGTLDIPVPEGALFSTEITSVVLPATLTRIGTGVFAYSNLSSINIPASVTTISESAFEMCHNLSSIYLESTTPPTAYSPNVFTWLMEGATTFIVDKEAIAAYKASSVWERYNIYCEEELVDYTYTDGYDVTWTYRYVYSNSSVRIVKIEGYSTDIDAPATLPWKEQQLPVTVIEHSFSGDKNLVSVDLSKTSIITTPSFSYCSSLETVLLPSTLESIGDYAFAGNEWNYEECNKLASIEIPASVKSIGEGAFQYCRNLNSIDLSKVETIGDYAFREACIISADLSSATSIGYNAFNYTRDGSIEPFFKINNTTPATLKSGAFPSISMFLVPGSAITDYKTANVWSDYASRIFGSDVAIQNLTLSAQADRSDLEVKIGDDNLSSVVDLTIKGSINSYDFMVMRNKMPFLRHLDLSEAHIVENNYEHYTGYHTEENKFPGYGLYNCKLFALELPQGITEIGYNALACISYLNEVVIPVGVTAIKEHAFLGCNDLRTVIIPEGVTELGYSAFSGCYNLETINIPKGVTSIPSHAFSSCYSLKSIVLPPTIEFIGGDAFWGCNSLKELRIPSSVRRIEDYAFGGTNIDDVYVYVIEPFDINQQTFAMTGNNFIGTLHAPKVSYWSYYYNTQWSQFLDFEEFDEPYENFYLEGDKDLNKETGGIRGEEGENPDAELGDASGLTVKDDVVQDLGNVDIEHNGEDGASMIVDGTGGINAESLNVHINVQSGRWYFFCFPFDLKKENISMGKEGTQYIFRWYDGKERAKGNSGWKNVTEEEGSYLKAAVGYIFQCSQSDVLTISLKDVKFKKEKKYNELVANTAANLQDASWNFVGNPYLSYYDMNSVGYDAPITVWNGHTYEAIKPGDDDYHFAPFEAFFVQKPEGTAAMEFDADAQTTLQGSQTETRASGARSITRAFNPDRRLINIVLSNGKASDRTRIVFNDKVSMEYELACDAAKFDAAGVPQLYTLDSRAVKYAINERPVAEGIVTLGYSVPAEGNYTLEAPRMDTKVFVKDNLTRTIHDFSKGNYEFYSEAGTFEGRFTILTKSGATGIDKVGVDEEDEKIYNLNGQRVNEATGKGIYIKNNRKEVNM